MRDISLIFHSLWLTDQKTVPKQDRCTKYPNLESELFDLVWELRFATVELF